MKLIGIASKPYLLLCFQVQEYLSKIVFIIELKEMKFF